jgi:hypothetical protein
MPAELKPLMDLRSMPGRTDEHLRISGTPKYSEKGVELKKKS